MIPAHRYVLYHGARYPQVAEVAARHALAGHYPGGIMDPFLRSPIWQRRRRDGHGRCVARPGGQARDETGVEGDHRCIN